MWINIDHNTDVYQPSMISGIVLDYGDIFDRISRSATSRASWNCRKHRDYRKFPMRLVLPDATKISKKRTLTFIIQYLRRCRNKHGVPQTAKKTGRFLEFFKSPPRARDVRACVRRVVGWSVVSRGGFYSFI